MRSLAETLELRVTTKELMQVKDAYNLYDTRSAIKFMFEERYPAKEILLNEGVSADPCAINTDVVVLTVKARNK